MSELALHFIHTEANVREMAANARKAKRRAAARTADSFADSVREEAFRRSHNQLNLSEVVFHFTPAEKHTLTAIRSLACALDNPGEEIPLIDASFQLFENVVMNCGRFRLCNDIPLMTTDPIIRRRESDIFALAGIVMEGESPVQSIRSPLGLDVHRRIVGDDAHGRISLTAISPVS